MALTEEFYAEIDNIIKQMRLIKEASEGVVKEIVKTQASMQRSCNSLKSKAVAKNADKIDKVVKATKTARKRKKK